MLSRGETATTPARMRTALSSKAQAHHPCRPPNVVNAPCSLRPRRFFAALTSVCAWWPH